MLLLPSDDLRSGPRMSKAIRSKGAPTLYCCRLPLAHFLGPLRAAQVSGDTSPLNSTHCSSRSAHKLFVGSS
ncbi:hypothetical protein TNCV_2211191 [Trichonephila clavipes]|nr:hypothetical protein TNCV_2211191 [Trichonephila clavipes]